MPEYGVDETYGFVSDIVKQRLDPAAGMRRLIQHCSSLCPDPVWEQIAMLDFGTDAQQMREWFKQVAQLHPPGDSIQALWFGLFDEVGEDDRPFARLYVSGAESYDTDDSGAGWACAPTYFPDGRYADSRVLRSLSHLVEDSPEDVRWLASYVLQLGYASQAVQSMFGSSADLVTASRNMRLIAVGFDSGDFICLPIPRNGQSA